jgi:hypothetical protein
LHWSTAAVCFQEKWRAMLVGDAVTINQHRTRLRISRDRHLVSTTYPNF